MNGRRRPQDEPTRCPRDDGDGTKATFRSPAKATRTARAVRSAYGVVLHVYRCRRCGNYHLTSQPQGGADR